MTAPSFPSSPTGMAGLLDQCRRRLGPRPRALAGPDLRALELPNPFWAGLLRDPLRLTEEQAQALRGSGEVVWGTIVTANPRLLRPGRMDLPANVVFSFDPHYDEAILELLDIAQAVARLPEQRLDREELKPVLDRLRKGGSGGTALLPGDLTEERAVYLDTLLLRRAALPGGVLRDAWLPLLALPGNTPLATALPWRFWPEELVRLWTMPAPQDPA